MPGICVYVFLPGTQQYIIANQEPEFQITVIVMEVAILADLLS